jgi:hypothetical protein
VTDFDIFLSYHSADQVLVESIAETLQTKGLKPWLDKWCLVPGRSWQQELATILRSCPSFAVCVGPDGLGDWAREELLVAQDRAAKERSFKLIPILLPGVPDPFDYGKLPPFLTQRTWIDFRRGLDQPRPLRALINAIKGLPPGSQATLAAGSPQCPYRGLETFGEEHAEFFFGRERDIQRLLEKLKTTRFVAVLGASGSGKSSLALAGLIPALKQGGAGRTAAARTCLVRVVEASTGPHSDIGGLSRERRGRRRHRQDGRRNFPQLRSRRTADCPANHAAADATWRRNRGHPTTCHDGRTCDEAGGSAHCGAHRICDGRCPPAHDQRDVTAWPSDLSMFLTKP